MHTLRIAYLGALFALSIVCLQGRAQSSDDGGFGSDESQTTLPNTSHPSDLFKAMQEEAEAALSPPSDPTPKPSETIKTSVARCFTESRNRDAGYQGRIEMKISVSGAKISKAEVSKNETGDPLVSECLTKAVQGAIMKDVNDRSFEWVFTHQ